MRITIDIDTKNPIFLFRTFFYGLIMYRKLPNLFHITKKGYHLGWINVKISEDDMFRHRLLLGDDKRRILLDRICLCKPRQTLFNRKIIFQNGKIVRKK